MKKFFKSTYFAIILLFIYVPITVMIVFSFNSGSTVFAWTSFSGQWYEELFRNSPFLKSILTSVFVAVVSTIISLIIGVAAAIGLGRTKPVTQKAWFNIANIPLINADVVTAVSLMVVFLLMGFQFGIGTLLLAHISFNVPYVLITVMPRIRKIDRSLLEAASDLGAKYWQVLVKVILPVLKPAIITAAVIAFSMSFDDFIISYFTGGDQTNVSTFIYTAKRVRPYIYAFGTLLVSIIVAGVIIWNAIQFVKTKKKQTEEEVKAGWYKAKDMNKYYKQLESLYTQLNNQTRIYISKNPADWARYWWYESVLKLYSIRNYDRKISRLEWKQYQLKDKIKNEKHYYAQLKSTNRQIMRLEQDIEKKSQDSKNLKRVAKMQLRLEQLIDKQEFLETEIAWIENRQERQADKVEKINKRLKSLKKEFNSQKNNLSKSDLNWYSKKIKALTDYKIELEEGKNNYNLRKTVEKLRETRELRNNKIYDLENKVEKSYSKVHQMRPASNFYRGIHINPEKKSLAKDAYLTKQISSLETKIGKVEDKIVKLDQKIEKKRQEVYPQDDGGQVRTKSWFARSWKVITASFIGIAAFTGLTVAYVKNNVYDLTIGNWGEYIDQKILNEFVEQTGYRVNYQTFDSNETLYNKLYTFTYDVMVPSDYMIEQLYAENKLHKLDYAQLTKLQADENKTQWTVDDYADYLKNGPYSDSPTISNEVDKDFKFKDYSVPYFWGDVAIIFNTSHSNVKKLLADNGFAEGTAYSEGKTGQTLDGVNWEIIKQAAERGMNVRLNDDPKNLFLIANEVLHQKANADNHKDVDDAFNYLKGIVSRNNVALEGDAMLASVTNGNFDVAIMYSGDAILATSEYLENNNGTFVLARPNANGQGTNIYFDSMVISSKTTHQLAAYRFINFMRDYAKDNSAFVGLASPFKSVMDELAADPKAFADFKDWYTPTQKGESYKYNPKLDPYLVEKFNNLLASK